MHRRHIEALIAIPFVFHLSTVQAMGAELPVPEPAAVTDVFEYEETEAVSEESEELPEETEAVAEETEELPEESEDVSEETEELPEETEAVAEETEGISEEPGEIPAETEELPEEAEDISEEETDAAPDQEQSEAEAGLLLTEEAPEAAKSAAQSDQGGDSMGLTDVVNKTNVLQKAGKLHSETVVAVIDTGINTGHSLFQGRLLSDPAKEGQSRSFIHSDTGDYEDRNGHGTHTAGIIAHNTPDSVKILALQALHEDQHGTAEDITKAIDCAVQSGAGIINMSLSTARSDFGTDDAFHAYTEALKAAIDRAVRKGVLIVASAGNADGDERDCADLWPAACDKAVTVSALGVNGNLYGGSRYGAAVDFCAPGQSVNSAWIGGKDAYKEQSGTSSAAAYITAALANIKLYNPGKSAEQLVELLKESAKDLGKSGKDDLYGYGMPIFSDGEVPRPARPQIESVEYACYAESEALKLTWEAQPGVQYEVLRRSGDGGKAEKIGTSSQGFFNDESYLNGHTYYYSIKCADEGFFKDSAVSEEKEYYAEGPDEMFWDISEEPIEAGKTRQIPESIVAYASRFSGVRWTSGDETIAKVSQSGLITGVGGGRTYIEVRDPDGRIRNRYDVVIVDKNKAGKNVYWYFDENTGTLTLTGSGDMTQGRDIVWPWSYEAQKGKTLPVKKIVIGENITSIGNSAFGNGLNRYSFHGLNTPVEIVGMEGVKKIGENAFSGLHIKGTFRLPENVSIGDFAFDGTSMEELYIPASVKNTGLGDRYIFSSGIGRYTVEEGNPLYSAQDGVLFDTGKTTLIACPKSLTGRYVIPETVKKIAYRAFFESNLTAVEIPEGVTVIDDEAFCDAKSLREIIFPDSVRKIGVSAFYHTALTSVRVPKLTESYDAFNGCTALRDLYYDGFRSEYLKATGEEYLLRKVRFHTDTGGRMQNGFLWTAKESEDGKDLVLTISGNGRMPDYSDPKKTPWYKGIAEITKVVLSDGITYVGNNVFASLGNLRSVDMSAGVQDFGTDVFREDTKLKIFERSGDDLRIGVDYLQAMYEKGKVFEPAVTVRAGGALLSSEGENPDYEVVYERTGSIRSGSRDGLIRILFKGNYEGMAPYSIPFIVQDNAANGDNIKQLESISISGDVVYNGQAQRPPVVVRSGRWTLREGVDYVLDYEYAVDAGDGYYTVTATGIGAYVGTVTARFRILPQDIADRELTAAVPEGNERPVVEVEGLTEGTDYTVTYGVGEDQDTLTAAVTGKGNYTGSVSAEVLYDEDAVGEYGVNSWRPPVSDGGGLKVHAAENTGSAETAPAEKLRKSALPLVFGVAAMAAAGFWAFLAGKRRKEEE
ncbi:MAG: S8 family serine peptidase [Lachnospiraceae bacterium]|nr:S8 family serine peptidase [Lachnospiraceae bacterium]